MTEAAILCLFAKPPRRGLTKTRLAAAIGDGRAALLAEAFVGDTIDRFRDLPAAELVLATTETTASEWDALPWTERWDQGSGDLGAKLERILVRALARAPVAIAVGADAPDLPRDRIDAARSRLAGGADAVVVPAEDGGFCLLALRRCPAGALAGIPWSRSDTCARTLERLRAAGLRCELLAPWRDIDESADLARLERDLRSDPALRRELPRTAAALDPAFARPGVRDDATLSVIVPVLDEAGRLGEQLDRLRGLAGIDEIVVVDGGSSDESVAIASARPGVRVLHSPRGRARQMNRGAASASGDLLLFLHADVQPPLDAAERIRSTLTRDGVVAGAFRTRTVAESRRGWIRPLLRIADARSRYSSLPYGDQALHLRASTFRDVGGFPDQPLMEDLELSRRLRRLGRIRIDRAEVTVSGRRFLARPFYYPLAINCFPLLYALGVSPARLARLYGNPR
ncbi:MAG: TIGR04283 family arsenosugar biosynthesis glycosyltransferase [Thermoanaerobaculia bacterium]